MKVVYEYPSLDLNCMSEEELLLWIFRLSSTRSQLRAYINLESKYKNSDWAEILLKKSNAELCSVWIYKIRAELSYRKSLDCLFEHDELLKTSQEEKNKNFGGI